MASKIILRELNDWSQLNKNDPFYYGIDVSREDNFGIHSYNGNLWTSGYVGVGRIYGLNGRPLMTHGREHVVVINSQYGMDPWKMLEKVMTDEEYDDYISELESDGKFLFKVFYDQPVVKLNQDQKCDADILYALSFINSCYSLCKKGIRRKLIHREENFNAKIKGRIDVQKNIRKNTVNGRNDRFYCKFIDFTADTIENRILKATLVKCRKIIERKFEISSEIIRRIHYCMNIFRGVRLVDIKNKDFAGIAVNGMYTYYKPLMKQAKSILSQKYMSYTSEDGMVVNKSVFTIPYMINMETVFEFYVRTVLREIIDQNRFELEKYSKRIFIERGVQRTEDALHGIHMMSYCIPDVIICDKSTGNPVYVFDAKYKSHTDSSRNDSHQLLSYVLLTGVDKCGFIFPGLNTEIEYMRNSTSLDINTNLINRLNYYEMVLGNNIDEDVIKSVIV